jgi:hypothetical protein
VQMISYVEGRFLQLVKGFRGTYRDVGNDKPSPSIIKMHPRMQVISHYYHDVSYRAQNFFRNKGCGRAEHSEQIFSGLQNKTAVSADASAARVLIGSNAAVNTKTADCDY